jgi:methylase of polypeptide subunit release factors
MPAATRDEGLEQAVALVERFTSNLSYYRSAEFDEFSTRDNFINPLLQALGWDVTDQEGLGPDRNVILEQRLNSPIDIGGTEAWDDQLTDEEIQERERAFRKYPDYAFRVRGQDQFYLEAKRPGIAIGGKVPAFQIKTYAWTSNLPVSAITDFEEFIVFDCTIRPDFNDPRAGTLLTLPCSEFVERWDELWNLLSREAVLAGSLGRAHTASRVRQRGAIRVDAAFLDDLSQWRIELAQELAVRNPRLDSYELAEATQRILDRLVFLRVCEDRMIEGDYVLRRYARLSESYRRLAQEFRRLDVVYNGQLFAEHFSERLEVSDPMFQRVIERLYPPFSPYRFDAFGADLLGAIYERFLGKTLEISPSGVRLEDKPEVRHAGGVYYTPAWVVDYIVGKTIGPLLEGKTPRTARNLRILDPACGSGSFLLGAFDYLIRWHEGYFAEHPEETSDRHYETTTGQRRLTTDAKGELLQRCLYGVDIDPQAVEVTQMSLYLKLLEGEERTALRDRRLFHGAILPPLAQNIRSGNSLLGTSDIGLQLLDTFQVQRRVNPFDWDDQRSGFGGVIAERGGFDAIIGNPPYTRVQVMRQVRPEETDAYVRKYRAAAEGSFDIASLFIERCIPLLRQNSQGPGKLGMIISRQFAETEAGEPLRGLLAQGQHVQEIVDFGAGLVFEGVGAYTLIIVAGSRPSTSYQLTRVEDHPSAVALEEAQSEGSDLTAEMPAKTLSEESWDLLLQNEIALLGHLAGQGRRLREVSLDRIFQGVVTGADNTVFRFLDPTPSNEHPDCVLVHLRGDPSGQPIAIERALLRPVFEGRTAIGRFIARPSSEMLLLPYVRGSSDERYELLSPEDLATNFPAAWEWLSRQRPLLIERSGNWNDRNWFAFSRRQNLELFEQEKILLPYMIDHLGAHWDEERHFFVNVATGGYGILPEPGFNPIYLTALLNSRLLSWSLRCYSRAWRGGWFAARKGNLVRLSIAETDQREQDQIVTSYQQCVMLRAQLETADSEHETELASRLLEAATENFDTLVEQAYDLNRDQRTLLSAQR